MRIGPFIWVSELGRTGADDPWAHRKGEPRTYTLLWAIYLMVGALLTIFAVRTLSGAGVRQWTYGCQSMMLLVFVGVCVLWPATRLSQLSPERPRHATIMDLLIMLIPVQAVVWPMPLLTGWTWAVTGGLVLAVAGWGVLVGALIARGCASMRSYVRTWVMASILGMVSLGPLVSVVFDSVLVSGGVTLPGWWALVSPLTVSHALTTTPLNLTPRMTGGEWAAGWVPMALGVLVWLWLSRRPDVVVPMRVPVSVVDPGVGR
ncbi:MAG: hypothetical protein Tsb0013_21080 [Phycisphaerales bacterium]